ncbi:MAG TPA: hypothetical protein VET85_06930 [Stellaceae bacterium]|nr:hypothetical protein [Stellaceae bacterium]
MTPSGTGRAWCAALALAMASTVALAWVQALPSDGAEVAAVFPPWTSREDVLGRIVSAGGLPVRTGIVDTVLVVRAERAGLVDRLYRVGAWAVIDPVAFGGCLTETPSRGS